MADNNVKAKISELLGNAKSAVICAVSVEDKDRALAIIALTKQLQYTGKSVAVIIKDDIAEEFANIFEENNVVYANVASPLKYIVSIDYSKSGVEKVLHDIDEEAKKVKFYIIPSGKSFDFEDVEYSQEGNVFDVTLTVGVSSFRDLGEIYENAEHLFKDTPVISIIDGTETLGDVTFNKPEDKGFSWAIKDIFGDELTEDVKKLLVSGIVDDIKLLEGGITQEQIQNISDAVDAGYDVNEIIQKRYFAKSYKNLDLQIKLMHNIRLDKEARVIWSFVALDDLKFAGIDRKSLDTKGRIIFNISNDFDLAFAGYEVEKDKIKVVIESNNPDKFSAEKIAGVFQGVGNERHAICILENTPKKDFEKNMFMVLENLYNIKARSESVSFVTSTTSVSSQSKLLKNEAVANSKSSQKSKEPIAPLTKPQNNDKNSPDIGTKEEPIVKKDAQKSNQDLLEN